MTRNTYIARIKRALRLDPKTKHRVIEGIQTEIQLSLDTGMTIDDAIEKLGQPREVANEYNQSYKNEPEYQAKRKAYRLKKGLIVLASVIVLIAAVFSFIVFRPVNVDYGTSEVYSKSDLDAAVRAVKLDFAKMIGCNHLSLRYAGDERSQRELENANKWRIPGDEYVACIVFDSSFYSPQAAYGAWNADSTYEWSWTIVKTASGTWKVLDKGYA